MPQTSVFIGQASVTKTLAISWQSMYMARLYLPRIGLPGPDAAHAKEHALYSKKYILKLKKQLKDGPRINLFEAARLFRTTKEAEKIARSLREDFIAAVRQLPLVGDYITTGELGKFVELQSRTVVQTLCAGSLQAHPLGALRTKHDTYFGVLPEEFINACTFYA